MPKTPRTRIFYLDTKTGRFASKATWKRSKQHGGTRYVRRVVKPKKRKKKNLKTEYQINVIYTSKVKKSNNVQVQISATGPSNSTREEVLHAVEHYIDPDTDGENIKDWKVKINFWEKYGKQTVTDDPEAREALRGFFYESDLEVFDKKKKEIL